MYHNYGGANNMPPMMNQQVPPVPVPEPPACPGGTIYTIQPGDTMFRIANRYGISLTGLIEVNPQITNPNVIYVGQRICVPAEITPPTPPDVFCPDGTIYIVQRGDTMFNIARRFGVTLQRLIAANPQVADPNVLEVGQRICIPVPDIPLPTGIYRVLLTPQIQNVLGATAFVNVPDPTLWISTFGLPKISELGDQWHCYYAWVVDRDTEKYFRVTLKDTTLPGILAGYGTTTGTLAGYDEIIVTAEPKPVPATPSGPVVLRGRLVT
ncbi:spore coat assembly protein SafA [Natronincola peptidivorans]|uniref:Spore coat assembly protein SafA n=1 Tax=Natronincola peptidivorans TaxID=426128 RepID=A0A1I0CAA0_9FIRM|nr:LysM peptidoglycan-binding domain-containing protein [Natronincola peptidivorans]SET16033.1 spore coat assembly protein SafA [Natronincola peptidivorans]